MINPKNNNHLKFPAPSTHFAPPIFRFVARSQPLSLIPTTSPFPAPQSNFHKSCSQKFLFYPLFAIFSNAKNPDRESQGFKNYAKLKI